MVALDLDDGPARAGGRDAERVACPLDDEHRYLDGVELVEAVGRWRAPVAPRRAQREREAEDACGARLGGCPAGDPCAGRTPSDDEREPAERRAAEMADDRQPRRVELVRGRRRASARDAIGLLDERDGEAGRRARVGGRDEVACLDAAARAVAEGEQPDGSDGLAEVDRRRPVRRLDLSPS